MLVAQHLDSKSQHAEAKSKSMDVVCSVVTWMVETSCTAAKSTSRFSLISEWPRVNHDSSSVVVAAVVVLVLQR